MKKLFLIILFALPLAVYAQSNAAGDELIKAKEKYISGLAFQGGGVAVLTLAAVIKPTISPDGKEHNEARYLLFGVGAGLVITGIVKQISAWSHIEAAGGKLKKTTGMNFGFQQNGIGLAYKF